MAAVTIVTLTSLHTAILMMHLLPSTLVEPPLPLEEVPPHSTALQMLPTMYQILMEMLV